MLFVTGGDEDEVINFDFPQNADIMMIVER